MGLEGIAAWLSSSPLPDPPPPLTSAGWKCVLHLPGVFSRPLPDLPEVRLLHLCSRSVTLWVRRAVGTFSFFTCLGEECLLSMFFGGKVSGGEKKEVDICFRHSDQLKHFKAPVLIEHLLCAQWFGC